MLSQSKEISSDLCCFYKGGISHNEILCMSHAQLPHPYRNKGMEISCESTANSIDAMKFADKRNNEQ